MRGDIKEIFRDALKKLKAHIKNEQSVRLKRIREEATILLTSSIGLARVRGETKVQIAVIPDNLFRTWGGDYESISANADNGLSHHDGRWKFISDLDRYCSKNGFFFWAEWLPPQEGGTPCMNDGEFIRWLFAEFRSKVVCWVTRTKNEAGVYSRKSIEKAEENYWQERENERKRQRERPAKFGYYHETEEMERERERHENEWRWH